LYSRQLAARPRWITEVTAWHGHIPFAFFIIELAQLRTVELGPHAGDSFCAFCQAVDELALGARCAASDTWVGDEHSGAYPEEALKASGRITTRFTATSQS
jgi:hypothetical protein